MIFFIIFFGVIFISLGVYYGLTIIKSKTFQKGKLLENDGKYDEAVKEYEKALTSRSDEEVLWRLVNLHEKMGKKSLAISRLKEMLKKKKYPTTVTEYDVKLKLATLLFQSNKDEESFKLFYELYQINSKDPIVIQYIIVITLGQRECDVAISFLNELLKINDQDANTYFFLGICYYENGDYVQAKKMSQEASRKNEIEDWRYILLEGVSHYYTSIYLQAIECFEKVASHKIENPKLLELIYQLIGRCHFKMNDLKKSFITFDNGKNILNKSFPTYKNIKIDEDIFALSLHKNDLDKSKSYLTVLLEKEPDASRWMGLLEIFNLISNNEIQLQESKLEKQSVEINTNKQDSVLETRIDLPKSFKDFMDHWEKTDILEDAVWDLSNLGRESYFDLGAYLYNHSANENENIKPKLSIQTPLGNNYANLAKKEFIETSRKLVKKLNFEIVKEDYNDIFLSTGDGIDYFTYIKGNDKDKFIVQIRRWNTNSIGELVIKDLAHKIKEKNAKQGIFITTGELSQEAMDYVEQSNNINIIQNKQLEFLLNGLISEN